MDWNKRIGDQKGSGSLWEKPGPSATDVSADVAFGLSASAAAKYPVAVFVRVQAVSRDDSRITKEETHGPVAVLQLLPDGKGVARLDQ